MDNPDEPSEDKGRKKLASDRNETLQETRAKTRPFPPWERAHSCLPRPLRLCKAELKRVELECAFLDRKLLCKWHDYY